MLERLRATWGQPHPPSSLDDHRVAEAWCELRTDTDRRLGLDDRTWADLDLDRVLATIDHTETALGRQLLYHRLRSATPWTDTPWLEALTSRFSAEPALRDTIGLQLTRAGTGLGNGLWVITRPDLIVTRWWYWAFPVLALAMLASLVIGIIHPPVLIVALVVAVCNLIVRMVTAWQIPALLAPMRQIGPLVSTAKRLLVQLGPHDTHAAEMRTSVDQLRPLRRISRWVSRDGNDAGELVASSWEYLNLLFILDANALLFSARQLRVLGPVLADVARWVGEVDVARSVASLRAEPRTWCIPVRSEQGGARASGIWHPLVVSPVVNDVELTPSAGLIITGANMSGKSTYLRAVGVAAVLARAINTCPAESWAGERFRVRSLVGRADDLSAGKSYYQVEADGVVALLADARDVTPTLFLLDELLRGTNTVERLAAGEAVLRGLLAGHDGASPHAVLVATHDGELVTMLADRYRPFHFRETIGPSGLTFEYRREPGPATTRTAIALLEATGAPSELVAAARARAAELDAGKGR